MVWRYAWKYNFFLILVYLFIYAIFQWMYSSAIEYLRNHSKKSLIGILSVFEGLNKQSEHCITSPYVCVTSFSPSRY